MLRTGALLLLLLPLCVAALSCDSSESVRVENKTDRSIVVYEDGVPSEIVRPGITREFTTERFRGTLTYEVRYFCDEASCDQSVLAGKTLTWEDLQSTDGVTIVVQ